MSNVKKFFSSWLYNDKDLENFYLQKVKISIIWLFKKKKYHYVKLQDLINEGKHVVTSLSTFETFYSIAPKTRHAKSVKSAVVVPNLNLYCWQSATINSHSSAIYHDNKLIVERSNNNAKFNEGFVISNSENYALLSNNKLEFIDDGFFLGGNGCYNWYHWLIELAPKLIFSEQIPTKSILIPKEVGNTPSMKYVLEILNKSRFQIIYLEKNCNYTIKTLYFINSVTHVPFNYLDKNFIVNDESYLNESVLTAYKKLLLPNTTNVSRDERIYLVRNSHRIPKNQEEIIKFLKKKNFKIIDMDNLSFPEQIELFCNASFIIGVSGAAWSNLLFCKEGTVGLCFLPENCSHLSTFSNLAQFSSVNLVHQFYKSTEQHYSDGFEINMDELKLNFDFCLRKNEQQ